MSVVRSATCAAVLLVLGAGAGAALDITETTATFTMEKADPEQAWWFLYEGPIAGTFALQEKLWGTVGGPGSLESLEYVVPVAPGPNPGPGRER